MLESLLSKNGVIRKNIGKSILGGGLVGCGAFYTFSSSNTENKNSLKGLGRQLIFWSKIGPIVADYYLNTSSSSPYVQYQQRKYFQGGNDATDERNNMIWKKRKLQILEELHERHAPEIFQVMIDLKGLYIKLGQVLSVTALPIPEPYRVRFRTLQSDVPGWEEFDKVVRPTLEKEFQTSNILNIFKEIEPVPCGAASIGQAHRAKLLASSHTHGKDGEEVIEDVIVKVQYPDAAWQVPADIKCVGDFLTLCVWANVVDETSARMSYDEFSRQFLSELDYQTEKNNLQTIYNSSLDTHAPYQKRNVVVPKVYDQYCTNKIITMSYLPGPKIEEEAKRQLAQLGIPISKSGGLASIIKDAAKDASNLQERNEEPGELVKRVSQRLDPRGTGKLERRISQQQQQHPVTQWKISLSQWFGNKVGINFVFSMLRLTQRISYWYQACTVSLVQKAPFQLPSSWEKWANDHKMAYAQASRLAPTKEWVDALLDVHGHQIFVLGLFNGDPHPGNILVIEDESSIVGEKNRLKDTKLGLIDFGQCKRLNPNEQVRIAKLILSIANNEPDENVAAAFRNLGIKTKNDSTEFLAKFGRLMFGSFLPEHLNHEWHMKLHKMDRVLYFPNELSMVYRTSLLLRGLAASLQMNPSISNQWKHHAQAAIDKYDNNKV